jgi:arylsulfatase A-like enzyme/Flp pilus assembly protein TadD
MPANVVLVTIDTLRADHLGCYGDKQIKTPNIDALAADGIRFDEAFAVVPVTLPSHASIMTGTYPMYSGMHDFSGNKLNPQQPTLASVLRAHGYATGAIIGAAVLDSRFGLNSGFDFYYDHFNASPLMEADLDETERPGNEVMDLALNWIRKNQAHPFFIWIHLYDPHAPYNPPSPYREEYKNNLYDGAIAFADAQVGRLLQYLKTNRLYSSTLIALTGDHGEGLGEHGEKTHGFFIYNSTMHVPLIFRLPAQERMAHKPVEEKVSLVDIMPTLLNSLNIDIPAGVQGHSLLSFIEKSERPATMSDIYGETYLPRLHFNWSELRGIEIGRYHFIDGPKPEIYDLEQDPHELHNLYSQKPALSAEYENKLTSVIRLDSSDHEMAQKTGLDPEMAERLKSLGYMAVSGGTDLTISDRKLPDPKDRIQMYELVSDAVHDSQHGDYQPSIQKLNEALKTEPNSIPVHYLLGLDYSRVHDFPKAISELQTTLKLSPDYAIAAYELGLAYAMSSQPADAVTYLKEAIALDHTNFSAAFNLGAAYSQLGRVDDAKQAFEQALTINPDYEQAHKALGQILLYQGQVDAAITHLRKATEVNPNDPGAHMALAKALAAKGMDAEAQREASIAQRLTTNQ